MPVFLLLFTIRFIIFTQRARAVTDSKEIILTSYRLRYKKGEQIIKQNDFGISIYKILSGKVLIFGNARTWRCLSLPLERAVSLAK